MTDTHDIIARFRFRQNPFVLSSHRTRVAYEAGRIISGLGQDIKDRAKNVNAKMDRFNEDEMVWTWKAGSRPYTIKVSFDMPDQEVRTLRELDLKIACSCPYWRYSGPEYHAKREDYLMGDPRGRATKPTQKDPDRNNLLCKHAYAVLMEMERRHIYDIINDRMEDEEDDEGWFF